MGLSLPFPDARKKESAEGQTRTVDTGIFSAVLYHLSYLGWEYYYRIRRGTCQDKESVEAGQSRLMTQHENRAGMAKELGVAVPPSILGAR